MLASLGLSKLDLLLHQCTIFLKVDVLVVQFILLLFKFAAHFIVLFLQLDALHLILLLLLVQVLLLANHHVP